MDSDSLLKVDFTSSRSRPATLVGAVFAVLMLLMSCSQEEQSVPAEEDLTVAIIMDPMLNDASEVLWDSAGFIDTYDGTIDLTPSTPEGWQAVIDASNRIDEVSVLLLEERYSLNRAAWNAMSVSLTQATNRARSAVETQDGDELFQAGAQLYQVCVACHSTFWSNNRFTEETPN